MDRARSLAVGILLAFGLSVCAMLCGALMVLDEGRGVSVSAPTFDD